MASIRERQRKRFLRQLREDGVAIFIAIVIGIIIWSLN